MKNKLLIIGASGHGKVVADIAIKMNRWREITFLDDDEKLKSVMGIKVLGKTTEIHKYINDYDIFVGIGNNDTRKMIQMKLEEQNASIPVLIHPNSIIGMDVEIGKGTVVMAGTVINPSVKVGKGCIINTASTIDHDSVIDDFVHISPGVHLAGMVKIGEKSWLGIGSTVINNINIVGECTIGAGSVVVKDITKSGTYIGIPAKQINS